MEKKSILLGGLLLVLLTSGGGGCSYTGYIVDSGLGHFRIMNRARPIEQILQSPYVEKSVKDKLRLVAPIKKFAEDELGLKATKNYEKYVQLDDKYVSWAVIAADRYELKSKQWTFPIVGSVPYLGFYSKANADEYAAGLRAKGYDVYVRGVPAYSTLGWFADPVLSSMLRRNEQDFADLIVHESFHASFWIKNNVPLNERLANFIGLHGGYLYVRQKYGDKAELAVKKDASIESARVFSMLIDEAIARYPKEVQRSSASFAEDKAAFYASLNDRYKKLTAREKVRAFKINFNEWNNATLLSHRNYYSRQTDLENLYGKCANDLPRLIRWFLKLAEETDFDEARLKQMQDEECL